MALTSWPPLLSTNLRITVKIFPIIEGLRPSLEKPPRIFAVSAVWLPPEPPKLEAILPISPNTPPPLPAAGAELISFSMPGTAEASLLNSPVPSFYLACAPPLACVSVTPISLFSLSTSSTVSLLAQPSGQLFPASHSLFLKNGLY